MSTGLAVFDTTVAETNVWLNELQARLHPCSRQDAYTALRAALQTLRDHLPPEGVLSLSAQLPLLLRGVYLEGWTALKPDTHDRSLEGFCTELDARLPESFGWSASDTARAAYAVLSDHVSSGERRKLVAQLPTRQRVLWPQAVHTAES